MDKYLSFIKEFVIQPLIDNTVLSNNLAFFHHRKKISDEMKAVQTLDDEEKECVALPGEQYFLTLQEVIY